MSSISLPFFFSFLQPNNANPPNSYSFPNSDPQGLFPAQTLPATQVQAVPSAVYSPQNSAGPAFPSTQSASDSLAKVASASFPQPASGDFPQTHSAALVSPSIQPSETAGLSLSGTSGTPDDSAQASSASSVPSSAQPSDTADTLIKQLLPPKLM